MRLDAQALDLQTSPSGVYSGGAATYIAGLMAQKMLSGKQAIGSPLISFADTANDFPTSFTPLHGECTSNGRVFKVSAPVAGVGIIALYNFSLTTGTWTPVGRLGYTVPNSPATTHTIRSVHAVDTGTTGWSIYVNTIGTVLANGGLFELANVDLADFVPTGFATLPAATAPGQKAVYWHQETGGTNNLQASSGFDIDRPTGVIGVTNGLVAAFHVYKFQHTNTITTVGAGGVTSDKFVFKTAVTSGVVGTILLLNNINFFTPAAAVDGIPANLVGQLCLFVGATTGFNIGKFSDFSSGSTTWPSVTSVNALDAANTNTAITPATAHFSQTLNRIIFQATSRWIVKKFVSNAFESIFGNSSDTQYRAQQTIPFQEFGLVSVSGSFEFQGWVFQTTSTVGQIGILAFHMRSMEQFDYSKIITKVIEIPNAQGKSLNFITPLRSFTRHYYRTNLTSDFSDTTTGWQLGPSDRDYSGISFTGVNKIQFLVYNRFERDGSTVPIQMNEAVFVYDHLLRNSDNWAADVENSTKSVDSPARSAAVLEKAYATSVPKIYFRAYSRATGAMVIEKNTVDHASEFEYSSNSGLSWNALGTIPNTINTTRIRYNWSTPIPTDVDVVWRES